MTMHLEGPWLSTTGKKRGKQKWASAEAKKKAEQLEADWNRKLAEFEKLKPKFSTGPYNAPKKTILDYSPKIPPGRENVYIASRDTGWVPCTRPADKVYTGDKIKGIGTMHKSNAVPVFSEDEAHEMARMRRG